MTRNGSRVRAALDPAWPVVMLLGIVLLNDLLNVGSNIGAALVGVAVAVIMILVGLLGVARGSRAARTEPVPLVSAWYLPWGAAFVIAGSLATALMDPPLKFWAVGILTLGVLYLLLGGFAMLRRRAALAE